MSISWSLEQRQVIEARDCNLLVSAAAGSGKTAVLVERIIEIITDPVHLVDVDRLLVVTFTNAAASEMRERIGRAIDQLRSEHPEDENLLRQATLLHHAKICTINSFCLYVLQNHYGEIGVDPVFRTAEEGEIKLLKKDVLEALFEEEYALGRDSFLRLTDAYADKKKDDNVRDMVLKLYEASLSCPWPREWISGLAEPYRQQEDAEGNNRILQAASVSLYEKLVDLSLSFEKLLEKSRKGADKYTAVLLEDIAKYDSLSSAMSYRELLTFLSSLEHAGNPTVRKTDPVDPALKDYLLNGRNDCKEKLKKLKTRYLSLTPEVIRMQAYRQYPVIAELIRLCLLFTERLDEAKRRKKIIDFSDQEHMALRILVDEKSKEPTPAAEELSRHFHEIMIDEYQDSNEIQEEILKAVSTIHRGQNNMFMVGDVKQSIYRFRQARPELFMDKYASYTSEESPKRKIELHRNYRSRTEVVDFVNDICCKLMASDLGGVSYDDNAALYAGASFPEGHDMQAEVLLLDLGKMADALEVRQDEEIDAKKESLEARMIAARIRRLMKESFVTDAETKELRPVQYRDIVILLRSLRGRDSIYLKTLEEFGIPAHVETKTGYFDTYEIETTLSLLRILDNPYQDIPMTAVLRSPYVGLDEEELADIRLKNRGVSFAEAALAGMRKETEEGEEEDALRLFGRRYEQLRSLSRELPIHELLLQIFRLTGFRNVVSAMPMGERRMANLDMLVEKAIEFERTSYKGLFHFIRYIDQMKKYDLDYGEADLQGENADLVHIMTIHKSKGLEFPIVFLSGLSREFNTMDANAPLVVHPDLGAGLPEITPTPKIRRESLYHIQIADRIAQENLGEELRVLYVALTRAREKLILTGTVPDQVRMWEKYSGSNKAKEPLPYMTRREAKSFLDWIIPAVMSYPEKYRIDFADPSELFLQEVERIAGRDMDRESLSRRIAEADPAEKEALRSSMTYRYPYASDITRKSKYSVSELKHASMVLTFDRMEGEAEIPDFIAEEKEGYIPFFAADTPEGDQTEQLSLFSQKKNEGNRGALRGTAVHRVMECLHFDEFLSVDTTDRNAVHSFVQSEIRRMLADRELTEDMEELVPLYAIERFLQQPCARRMAAAAREGLLFKEKPFVMEHDGVLVQGIIDVFWIEGDRIVLLDYKTDRIGKPEELLLRYRTQMELYAEALGRVFSGAGRQLAADSCILYSFHLHCEVEVHQEKEEII